MNTICIFTGVLTCLLLMFTLTHAFALSGHNVDDEHLTYLAHPSAISSNRVISLYPDDAAIMDNSDEHDMEKRRFNAWAGKRDVVGKRRFNAWAGRR